ncbi:MAG: prealbumin-like fold domain-containing protein [Erysipelotrichaceae bacterium]|nr:prealbumin-like fold domain-containing protein [Erysipelotrichaceae bacterium]
MQNVTFELYNADKTVLIQSKKTDSGGDLTFSNLKMGTYYLRENSEYEITSPEFGADGFSKSPVILNSTQPIVFKVGNFRNTVETTPPTEVIPPETPPTGNPPPGPPTIEPPIEPPGEPPDNPPETEIVEDEPPPLGLPPTGEVPPDQLYVLGALLMVAGMFLKRLN